VEDGTTSDFEVDVILVEQTGNRLLITAETPTGEEIRVITAPENRPEEGGRIPVSIDRERVHVFDLETGDIVASSRHQTIPTPPSERETSSAT
jgi:ABC-type sugar transport system ATPase subunit